MGGLDALVAAGRSRGRIRKVWAVNPIVDLAAWVEDIREQPIEVLRDPGVDDSIEVEIGTTDTTSELWLERNPFSYLDQLASCEIRIDWSPDDFIPNQGQQHGGALAEAVRASGGAVKEVITLRVVGRDGRAVHETFDAWSGLTFLAGP